MPLPWWVCTILANVSVIAIEYHNRTIQGGFFEAAKQTWWIILMAQFFLYYGFNGASHWLVAWGVFVVGSAMVRLAMVNTFAGDEVANWWFVVLGVSTILLGGYVLKKGLA